MTTWDFYDEAAPSSKVVKLVGELTKCLVAVSFPVGYSSHQFFQHLPSLHQDQWVHAENVLPKLCCLL